MCNTVPHYAKLSGVLLDLAKSIISVHHFGLLYIVYGLADYFLFSDILDY